MSCRGFTLIELLVVLAVLALVLIVAVPNFSTAIPGIELKGAARDVAAGLRSARSQAITGNREAAFTLDVGSRTFAVSGQDEFHELPEDVDVSLVTARSQQLDATSGIIQFFPDGSSTGGRVSLARGSSRYHVDVNWLTGHVTIRDE